jgi:hypothetical protein
VVAEEDSGSRGACGAAAEGEQQQQCSSSPSDVFAPRVVTAAAMKQGDTLAAIPVRLAYRIRTGTDRLVRASGLAGWPVRLGMVNCTLVCFNSNERESLWDVAITSTTAAEHFTAVQMTHTAGNFAGQDPEQTKVFMFWWLQYVCCWPDTLLVCCPAVDTSLKLFLLHCSCQQWS